MNHKELFSKMELWFYHDKVNSKVYTINPYSGKKKQYWVYQVGMRITRLIDSRHVIIVAKNEDIHETKQYW